MTKRLSFTFVLICLSLTTCFIQKAWEADTREVLRYSCSDQILFAFERERLIGFCDENNIDINLNVASSRAVLDYVFKGFSDIASTTSELTPAQIEAGGIATPFCRDSMAIITNGDCPVKDISIGQLINIFGGQISNWKETGGPDMPMVVVTPLRETGAYGFFKKTVMKNKPIKCDMVAFRSWMIVEMIKNSFPWAISFITHGALDQHKDSGIKTLSIDGIEPTHPDYPYMQTFYFVTKGTPKGMAKEFMDFVTSEKGREIIIKRGMTPIP